MEKSIMNEELLQKKEERIIGVDLVKIISMIMIISLHVIVLLGFIRNPEPTIVSTLSMAFYRITRCAVNCYAIASGFLYINNKYKLSRLLYLWIQTFFYSVLIALFFKIFFPETCSTTYFLSFLLPITAKKYWYVSSYFLMFLFIPLLNKGIHNLSKKTFKNLLWIILVVASGLSIIYKGVFNTDPFRFEGGLSAIWLIIMYLIGAYFKLYGVAEKTSLKILILLFLISNLISVVSYYIMHSKGLDYWILDIYNFPLVLISAVSLFLIFAKIKTVKNAIIEKCIISFSTATLGVYLIHMHSLFYSEVFSKLSFIAHYNGFKFILLSIAVVLGIFIGCSLVDILRKYLFKAIKIDALCKLIDKKMNFND